MPPFYLLGSTRPKKMIFHAWRNYCDLMRKEVAETKLAEYENDPRIESMRANPARMRKHELVELARKELGLTATYANECTVKILREMIKQGRKANEEIEDPMKKLPKGFSTMRKTKLIAEAKNRGLILDQICPDTKDWSKLTNGKLQLAIHNHVKHSNGEMTVTPKNKTTPFQKTSMSDDSSDDFQEVCMELIREENEKAKSSSSRKTKRSN